MLFESPTQIRQRLYQDAYQMGAPIMGGGLFAPAYQGIGKIGTGLGAMVGSSMNPEVKRAQAIQGIQQRVFKDMPEGDFANRLPMLATELAKSGYTGEALKVIGYAKELNPSADFTEFYKEERKYASQTVKSVDDRAANIRESYGKLENLAQRAKTSKAGSLAQRSAINSMIANIVRLNSPGIVSESELQTYSGGQGTTAAFIALLAGRDPQYEALMAGIDPSGAANPDDLLGIGSSLILGQAQPLFDQYDDARARATRSGMSQRAQDTIFGESKNLTALRGLTESAKQVKTKPAPKQQADYGDLTPAEIRELQALEKEFGR